MWVAKENRLVVVLNPITTDSVRSERGADLSVMTAEGIPKDGKLRPRDETQIDIPITFSVLCCEAVLRTVSLICSIPCFS